MRERDWKRIQDIRETLIRIDAGRFGFCEDCGEALPVKRILAVPLSRLCRGCQERMEQLVKPKDKGAFLPARGPVYAERNFHPEPDRTPDSLIALGIQDAAR